MKSHRVNPAVGLVACLLASAPAAAADPPPDADDIDTYRSRRAASPRRPASIPAEYRDSNTTTFTRDVDVLPEGHRPENWAR